MAVVVGLGFLCGVLRCALPLSRPGAPRRPRRRPGGLGGAAPPRRPRAFPNALARGVAFGGRGPVLGPKGGTGKTLTSCNVAVALALAGAAIVLVDLDLQFGDVGLALGLKPEHTIYDLAVSGGSLDVGILPPISQNPLNPHAVVVPTREGCETRWRTLGRGS